MRIVKETNINFMGQGRFAFFLSGVVILAGLISLLMQGGPRLSIDFKGGTLVAVQFTEDMNVNDVRQAMGVVSIEGQSLDFSRAEIKHFGTARDISVRLPIQEDQHENFPQLIVNHLYESFPAVVPADQNDFILSVEKDSTYILNRLNIRNKVSVDQSCRRRRKSLRVRIGAAPPAGDRW